MCIIDGTAKVGLISKWKNPVCPSLRSFNTFVIISCGKKFESLKTLGTLVGSFSCVNSHVRFQLVLLRNLKNIPLKLKSRRT